MTDKIIATESGHWYERDGTPRYELIGANGKLRNTTLRDAKKFGYLPSVTTIIKVLSAPGLEIWKRNNLLLAALTLPKGDDESLDDYADRVVRDAEEQASKARQLGTDIHAAIESAFADRFYDSAYFDHVAAAMSSCAKFAGDQCWESEKSFASDIGYAGKVDLHCTTGGGYVIDFKTTAFDDAAKLKTWDEHHMQLAAYRQGLGMPFARCAICYVSTTTGQAHVIEVTEDELSRGQAMFFAAFSVWKAKNRYSPIEWQEAA